MIDLNATKRSTFVFLYMSEITEKQLQKIKTLLEKYNPILLNSMKLSISEDFFQLIIQNNDDTSFELSTLLQNKEHVNTLILKEFLKLNSSSSVLSALNEMDDPTKSIKDKIGTKELSKQKRKKRN